jgi:hypothetical protein
MAIDGLLVTAIRTSGLHRYHRLSALRLSLNLHSDSTLAEPCCYGCCRHGRGWIVLSFEGETYQAKSYGAGIRHSATLVQLAASRAKPTCRALLVLMDAAARQSHPSASRSARVQS